MLRILLQSLKIVSILALALLVAVGGVRFFAYATERTAPANAGEVVLFEVRPDESSEQISERLQKQGLIKNRTIFDMQLRLGSGALEPGTHTLRHGMSVEQIAASITGAEVAQAPDAPAAPGNIDAASETFDITIPEGWRIEQIAEEYDANGGEGGFDAFMAAVEDVDRAQYDFLADLPDDLPLEGYLFPDTYTFKLDDPAANVAMMLNNFDTKYTQEWRDRTQQMGINVHQALTLAALVEKEAAIPDERPTIADVYISRWEQDWELEADPTVQYVVGERGAWWEPPSEDDLFVESPYNTYQNTGLPPGPIANPGTASIQAVLFPANTDYMFFVAKGDTGEHAFAVTKEEQDANVEQFQNADG